MRTPRLRRSHLPAARPAAALTVLLLKMSAALSARWGRLLLIAVSSASTAAAAAAAATGHAGVVTARSISALPIRIGPRLSEFAFSHRTFAEIAISGFPIGDISIGISVIRRIASAEIAQRAFRLFRTCVKGFRT
jgi:hypothetical protein